MKVKILVELDTNDSMTGPLRDSDIKHLAGYVSNTIVLDIGDGDSLESISNKRTRLLAKCIRDVKAAAVIEL